jgi:hypothetical protein
MEQCPKCGGKNGYTYKLLVAYTQECDWKGKAIDAEPSSSSGYEYKLITCLDCNKTMRKIK